MRLSERISVTLRGACGYVNLIQSSTANQHVAVLRQDAADVRGGAGEVGSFAGPRLYAASASTLWLCHQGSDLRRNCPVRAGQPAGVPPGGNRVIAVDGG